MNEAFLPALMVVGFLAFFGLIVWLGAKASARACERVLQLAGRLGLELEEAQPVLGLFYPSPRATGRIRGKAVAIYNYTTGSGKSRKTWSALSVTPATEAGLTFSFTRQGFGTKVQEFFGYREITVGQADFDAAWFVQTNAPDFLRPSLVPEVLEKFRGLRGAFKLERGEVTYVEAGQFDSDERCRRFEAAAGLACDLADIAEVHARHKGRG